MTAVETLFHIEQHALARMNELYAQAMRSGRLGFNPDYERRTAWYDLWRIVGSVYSVHHKDEALRMVHGFLAERRKQANPRVQEYYDEVIAWVSVYQPETCEQEG